MRECQKKHNCKFYHSKIEKFTFLKKYTNWAKLSHVTQDLEFTSWPTSCELYCPDIYTVCDTVSARFACIILPEFHTEFFKKINHTNALQENEHSAAAPHGIHNGPKKFMKLILAFYYKTRTMKCLSSEFFDQPVCLIQIFQKSSD